jgi:hypothetical protein
MQWLKGLLRALIKLTYHSYKPTHSEIILLQDVAQRHRQPHGHNYQTQPVL